jgi:hypothetical protein
MRSVARYLLSVIRRACPVAVVSVALLWFGAAPASAQCGETTNVSPRQSLGLGAPPLAVGDSVLYDAAGALSY